MIRTIPHYIEDWQISLPTPDPVYMEVYPPSYQRVTPYVLYGIHI